MPAPEWLLAAFTTVAAGSVSRSCIDGSLSGIWFWHSVNGTKWSGDNQLQIAKAAVSKLIPESSKKEKGLPVTWLHGNEKTNMPKQAFSVPWIGFKFTWFATKTIALWPYWNVKQDPPLKNLKLSIFVKRWVWNLYQYGLESLLTCLSIWKPPKLCLEVYLHSINPLNAQVIEISNAENVIFNKNLLCCTATHFKKWKCEFTNILPSFLLDYI